MVFSPMVSQPRRRSEVVLEPATDGPEIFERIGIELLVLHSDSELLVAAEIEESAGAPHQPALVFVSIIVAEKEGCRN
jgi:hypothetical protein